jgi:hypothetical protein
MTFLKLNTAVVSRWEITSAAAVLFSIFASGFVGGCTPLAKKRSENDSQAQHAALSFTNGNEPWQWVTQTDAETDAFLTSLGYPKHTVFPPNHPATVRMQAWLDALMVVARQADDSHSRNRATVRDIPRPIVRISKGDSINASVNGIPICLELKGRIDQDANAQPVKRNANQTAIKNDVELSYDIRNRLFSASTPLKGCQTPKQNPEPAAFVRWFNAKNLQCQLKIFENDVIVPPVCMSKNNTGQFQPFGTIRMSATVPLVVFGEGMMRAASTEHEAVSILAHELAHILKSHAANEDSGYDYFYTIAKRNPKSKPVPDSKQEVLGEKLRMMSRDLSFYQVAGSRFDGALFPSSFGFANANSFPFCSASSSCQKACQDLNAFVLSKAFATIVENQNTPIFLGGKPSFPLSKLSDEQVPAYLTFEQKLSTCAAFEPVQKDDPQGTYMQLTKGSPTYVQQYVASNLPANREQLMTAITQAFRARAKQKKALYAEALDTRLGYYTVEQEADELALELLTLLGVNPATLPMFEMKLGGIAEQERGLDPLQISHFQCTQLRANNWKSLTGGQAKIPLGSIADLHHGSCFRVYNADREIATHGWKIRKSSHPTPAFEAPWGTLLDQ